MSYYRIRRDGIEFPVSGLQALERLVLEGDLAPSQRVYDPACQDWIPASEVADLQDAFDRRAGIVAERKARRSSSTARKSSSSRRKPPSPPSGDPDTPGASRAPSSEDSEGPPPPSERSSRTAPPEEVLMELPDDAIEVTEERDRATDRETDLNQGSPSRSRPPSSDPPPEDPGWEDPDPTTPGTTPPVRSKGSDSSPPRTPDRERPANRGTPPCPISGEKPRQPVERGEVIPFPGRGSPSGALPGLASEVVKDLGPGEVPDLEELFATRMNSSTSTERTRKSPVRLSMVVGTVLGGLLLLFAVQYYVNTTAQTSFDQGRQSVGSEGGRTSTWEREVRHGFHGRSGSRKSGADASSGEPEGASSGDAGSGSASKNPAGGEGENPAEDDPYAEMERSLWQEMRTGIIPVATEDGLETSLLLELSALDIDVRRIQAPVLAWAGQNGDLPKSAEITVWYIGKPGDLDRELGAIGLVAGKYAQHYNLDLPPIRVLVEHEGAPTRERLLSPQSARRLYLHQVSLVEFLTSGT